MRYVYLICWLLLTRTSAGQTVRLNLEADSPFFGTLELGGADSLLAGHSTAATNLKALLRVYPKELWPGTGELPPMLGHSSLENGVLRFRPRFLFVEGKKYVAVFQPGNETDTLVFDFEMPVLREKVSTELLAIFPTAEQLPANQLKLYLYFSAPMSLENPYPHIRLLDENGVEAPAPFLELDPPLWDAAHRRLTLWFDPGRIKRGLIPNLQHGPPLLPGRRYTLQVSQNWKDASGQSLAGGQLEKLFVTLPPDREKPEPAAWVITPPAAGTRQALLVRFPEPMDKGTLENTLGVADAEGRWVAGTIETAGSETVWRFVPETPWTPGAYRIVPDERLEDLAGNNLRRPFDRDVEQAEPPESVLELCFTVKERE